MRIKPSLTSGLLFLQDVISYDTYFSYVLFNNFFLHLISLHVIMYYMVFFRKVIPQRTNFWYKSTHICTYVFICFFNEDNTDPHWTSSSGGGDNKLKQNNYIKMCKLWNI